MEPLRGHTDRVNSVAFSHDGKHIVSGSSDQTIRVWDVNTGETVVGPLQGHTQTVNSVAISPDDKHIVSGSSDQTIRVWNAETGELVVGPLKGHIHSVNCVAFSHNGKCIISGSYDQTIRVWDAKTGAAAVGLLQENISGANSAEFFQDEKHIISSLSNHYDTLQFSSVPNTSLTNEFTDGSGLEDGWVHNSSSALLFWVPSWNRMGLCWPRNSLVIGQGVVATHLDLHNFMHGDVWQQCKA